jgi:pyroglutamyl-peptidase
MSRARAILVTGFEPFGPHAANPSEQLARAVDGRAVGGCAVHGAVLPVEHVRARAAVAALLHELRPDVVIHLGLAGGRARIALERVGVNVMEYSIPDNAGFRAVGEPCVPGGPAAYVSTLPLAAMLAALLAGAVPAYVSNTAGTYLCNHTLYSTLHAVRDLASPPRVGFVHLPLLPAMVAAAGTDEPSMDLPVMLRALQIILGVVGDPEERAVPRLPASPPG